MRAFVVIVAFAYASLGRDAHGQSAEDEADALLREGSRHGEAGRWAEAIACFRRADALYPRALDDCNVGIAYAGWGRLAQASLHFALCRARVAGQLPDWVLRRHERVLSELRAGPFGRLRLSVEPADATAATPAFEPDEAWAPAMVQELWLPAGLQRLSVRAQGHRPELREVSIEPGGTTSVLVVLTPDAAPPALALRPPLGPLPRASSRTRAPPAPRLTARPGAGPWPLVSVAGGGVLVALGVAFHALAIGTKADAEGLDPVPPGEPYPEFEGLAETYRLQRGAAIGMYSAGAIATAVGVIAWLLDRRSGEAR